MNNNEIKNKVWDRVKDYIDLDDNSFNNSAYSVKVTEDYNLVVWCDVDYAYNENDPRYFIVSIRYNPYDELFGDDISNLEWSTNNTSKEELDDAIDLLLRSIDNKILIKNSYGYKLENKI